VRAKLPPSHHHARTFAQSAKLHGARQTIEPFALSMGLLDLQVNSESTPHTQSVEIVFRPEIMNS